MNVYLDTSCLISAYMQDGHSREIDQRLRHRPSVCVTPFHRAEFSSALYQLFYLKRAALAEIEAAWACFEVDCDGKLWTMIDFPESAWRCCVDLARRYSAKLGMRNLDSLHVACALELGVEAFWTFDERQARLADAVGLKINIA